MPSRSNDEGREGREKAIQFLRDSISVRSLGTLSKKVSPRTRHSRCQSGVLCPTRQSEARHETSQRLGEWIFSASERVHLCAGNAIYDWAGRRRRSNAVR